MLMKINDHPVYNHHKESINDFMLNEGLKGLGGSNCTDLSTFRFYDKETYLVINDTEVCPMINDTTSLYSAFRKPLVLRTAKVKNLVVPIQLMKERERYEAEMDYQEVIRNFLRLWIEELNTTYKLMISCKAHKTSINNVPLPKRQQSFGWLLYTQIPIPKVKLGTKIQNLPNFLKVVSAPLWSLVSIFYSFIWLKRTPFLIRQWKTDSQVIQNIRHLV